MNVRKLNRHRSRLSCEKPTGYGWKYKAGRRVLLMWNTRGGGGVPRRKRVSLKPHQLAARHATPRARVRPPVPREG